VVVAEEQKSAWPHGERKERSRCVTCVKEVGMRCRSRAFPRRVSEMRVLRSKRKKLRHTRDNEFRVRVSETAEKTFNRISSGRLLTVVPSPISGKTIPIPTLSIFNILFILFYNMKVYCRKSFWKRERE